jgi:hypothetical protein
MSINLLSTRRSGYTLGEHSAHEPGASCLSDRQSVPPFLFIGVSTAGDESYLGDATGHLSRLSYQQLLLITSLLGRAMPLRHISGRNTATLLAIAPVRSRILRAIHIAELPREYIDLPLSSQHAPLHH